MNICIIKECNSVRDKRFVRYISTSSLYSLILHRFQFITHRTHLISSKVNVARIYDAFPFPYCMLFAVLCPLCTVRWAVGHSK